MLSAIRRAITSVAAPGPVGTMILIGRAGQFCAFAPPIEPKSSAQTIKSKRIFIVAPC